MLNGFVSREHEMHLHILGPQICPKQPERKKTWKGGRYGDTDKKIEKTEH